MKQLKGADEMWFSLESPDTGMHLTSLDILAPPEGSGGKRRADVLEYVGRRLHRVPLRQKRVLVPARRGCSFWMEDEEFDLDHHVREGKLAAPGGWDQLCAEFARHAETPLDFSRPLWEIHLIEGVDAIEGLPKGCFALIFKLHHGQFDGGSVVDLLNKLFDTEPDAVVERPADPWKPERAPAGWKLMARAALNDIQQPGDLFSASRKMLDQLPTAAKAILNTVRETSGLSPGTRFSATIPSSARALESRVFPFGEIQAIRKSVPQATVNDVVLTICGGGLRKYLEHHGELPDDALSVMVPISVRKEEEIGEGGNKVFTMMASIGTDEGDPVERLRKIHRSTIESKQFSERTGSRNMVDLLDATPGAIMNTVIEQARRFKLTDRLPAAYSGVAISNVPGPRETRYFCGARVLRKLAGGFLMDGMGLLLVVTTYAGELTLTLTSCPEMLPDPAFLAQCMEDAFAELNAASQAPARA